MRKLDWRKVASTVEDPVLYEEMEALENTARQVREELGDGLCIEVGSYLGKSTLLLAQFFKVMAIDLWGVYEELGADSKVTSYQDIGGVAFGKFIRNMLNERVIPWEHEPDACLSVVPICSTSEFLDYLPSLNAHMAFVDAEHTWPAAYHDMVRCSRHIVPGGIMALHDVARPGWGWGDCSRSQVDPWAGNYKSYQAFLSEHMDFKVEKHIQGILFMRKDKAS